MRVPEEKLAQEQETALLALLSCRTIREAAERAKVAESTVLRWLTTPLFRNRYEAERRQLFESAKNALRSAAAGSVATLTAVQEDQAAPAGARVTAAKAILELCMRIHENDDIIRRLERLEDATGGGDER
ncbi:MAG: hypothetical protein ACR2JE_05830 [Acidobacteriaceae bacterium]